MTAPTPPLDRLTVVLERIVCGLAWTLQAGAAIAYLVVTAQPVAWRPHHTVDPIDTVFFWLADLSFILIWALSLWGEARNFYDRRLQRLNRKVGATCHAGALLLAILTATQLPQRAGWFAFLGTVSFAAFATWASWMQTRILPAEDQTVIDEIIARETAQRIAIHQAGEREKRRVRLTEIVSSLGYTLTEPTPSASAPAGPPAVKWKIPAGKHVPLVYFIRNGNRMKIGTTTDLKRRIRTLALREDNVALLVQGDQRVERSYHKQFASLRVGNTEWFDDRDALADYVQAQIEQSTQKGQQK